MAANAGGKLVLLGRIAGAHGVRGDVKITSFTAMPESIGSYGALSDGKGCRLTIEVLRPLKGTSVSARIAGVKDRNGAEALKGVELFVERAKLPETDDDEWYYSDLIGLKAVTPEDERIGEIIAVQNFGAGDLLEIRREASGKTVLIPFTEIVVPVVDIRAGRVIIDEPEEMGDAGKE
ncbi:MAG: ribosome maturation factor RimM [Hyphomicrobiales bacterium]|nr:ribosome maturation factor RimM [Hyphomicrobiales bacterium]